MNSNNSNMLNKSDTLLIINKLINIIDKKKKKLFL